LAKRTAHAETLVYGRSAGLLTVAFGAAGVLVYLYFAIASHKLDSEAYGEVVVLWTTVYVISLTLYRPTELLLTRSLADTGAGGGVLRVAAGIQLAVSVAAVLAVIGLRAPIEDDLLSGDATAFAVLVAALVGFAAAYYARGFFAGTRRFGLYAALLLTEAVVRLAFVVVYAAGYTDDANVVLLGIAAAPLLSLAVVPFVLASKPQAPGGDAGTAAASPALGDRAEFTLTHGGGFAAAVLLMMLGEQVIVGSGALFVRAAEGAAAAGFIFNMLMVARAPLLLFQAIAASLLPHLTTMRTRGDQTGDEAFRHSVRTTLLVIAAFAAAVTVGVVAIGPQVMQIAFGDKFTYDRLGLAVVAVGMGFYLSAATLNQAALAQAQARRAALCWVICATAFVVINLLGGVDAVRRVEFGFMAVSVLLCGLLYAVYRRPHPRAADSLEPGASREIEARLAAADEIG
jgi:O-antigen/teichoic acid export membrane protein